MANPMKFIQEQCSIHPKQSGHFDELGTLYQARYRLPPPSPSAAACIDPIIAARRLWSQLSNKLGEVCRNEFFQKDKHLIRLYESGCCPLPASLPFDGR